MSQPQEKVLMPTQKSRYTTAIIKGGAMVDETWRLLKHWNPGEDLNAFAKRVHGEDLLGNATAKRTSDIVRKVFAPRFLRPSDKPALILKHIMNSGLSMKAFTEMLFVYACRNDRLLYDFTCLVYWPSARRGRTVLDTEIVLSFLSEATIDGRIEFQWTPYVLKGVARGILALLRDVGLLREVNRTRKEIVQYRMSDEGVALLARELHEAGVTDSSLCSHPDWGLFGMDPQETYERINNLGDHRGIIAQKAGSVIHFTWFIKSIEEMIDVLSR